MNERTDGAQVSTGSTYAMGHAKRECRPAHLELVGTLEPALLQLCELGERLMFCIRRELALRAS